MAARILPWLVTLLAGAAVFYWVALLFHDALDTERLVAAAAAPGAPGSAEILENGPSIARTPAHFETLAEYELGLAAPDFQRVKDFATRALDMDSDRPFVWAMLAYVDREQSGRVTQAGVDALTRSMGLCPMCDEELVRWRFNFILANWEGIPDPLRRSAFEQADTLRWDGRNSEFLAEMRIKAEAAGLPYASYRDAVVSPVPSAETVHTIPAGPPPLAPAP